MHKSNIQLLIPQTELMHSLKSPRDIAKVVDADWSGSDRPVVATVAGTLQVYDITLKTCSCPIEDRDLPGQ